MKDLSIIRANSGFVLCVIATLFLFGCQSTTTEEVEIDCRAEGTETCAEENGDDRGYNPCLVNKNLPVCKR